MLNKNYKNYIERRLEEMDKVYKEKYKAQDEDNKKRFFSEWLGNSLEFENLELAKFLLKNGADVTFKDSDGYDALARALVSGNIEVTKFIIKHCKNIDSKDYYGWTTLMWAVYIGDFKAVKLLIENGANVNAKNNLGNTALMYALHNNNLEITKFLIKHGADVNAGIIEYAESIYNKFVEYGTPTDLLKSKKQFIDYLKSLT